MGLFASIDSEGMLEGGFHDDAIAPPPPGAIAIDEAQWRRWLAAPMLLRWVAGPPGEAGRLVDVPPPVVVPPAPAFWEVRKLLLVDRLDADGLLLAAMQALASDARAKFRWDAATAVRSDDAQVRALLAAIGADPDVYLAPEGEAVVSPV